MPTGCTPVQNLITPLVQGRLSAEDEAVVRSHLQACESCRKDYKNSTYFSELLGGSLELPDPPKGMAEVVVARASGSYRRTR